MNHGNNEPPPTWLVFAIFAGFLLALFGCAAIMTTGLYLRFLGV